MIAEKLRKSILQAAIEGKLTEQLPEDGDARDLVAEIKKEKEELIKAGKIKKEKPLPDITEEEIPFDIPDNWCWVRLGDYIQLKSGIDLKPDKYNDKTKGIPYITGASNIENGNVLINRWTEYPTRFAEPMDILLTCKGTVGKLAITNTEAHIARQIMSIQPFKNLEREYLLLLLEYNTDHLQKNSQGIIPGIRREDVLNMLLPFPPHNEQLRIFDIFKKYSLIVDSIEVSEIKLGEIDNSFEEKLKSSILQAAMQGKLTEQLPEDGDAQDLLEKIKAEKQSLIEKGKLKKQKPLPPITEEEIPFDIPDNWVWVRLGNVGKIQTGNTPKKTKPENYGDFIPFISPGDIKNGAVDYHNNGLSEIGKNNGRLVNRNSILQVCIGGSMGKAAINQKCVSFNQQINSFTPYIGDVNYYYYILSSKFFIDTMKNKSTGTATPIINKTMWSSILIPLAPISEQEEIVKKISGLEKFGS